MQRRREGEPEDRRAASPRAQFSGLRNSERSRLTEPTHRPTRPDFALPAALAVLSAMAIAVPDAARGACPGGMTAEQAEAASEVIPYELTTPAGPIRIGLLPGVAPETVAQFLAFAEAGYYDGTFFHNAWLDGGLQGQYVHNAIDAGAYRVTAQQSFEEIDFPPTSVPDETCLRNDRGAVISLEPRTFDGPFEIYVRDPRPTWCSSGDPCFLDADYIVFARVLDDQGIPIGAEDDLGPAGDIGSALGLDGFLNLDDPLRRSLRRVPVMLDAGLPLTQQTTLSSTAACYRTGQLPTPFVAMVANGQGGVVRHDSGTDVDEPVIVTTPEGLDIGDGACGDLIYDLIIANGGASFEPQSFACDTDSDPQRLFLWQTENRCGSAYLDENDQLSDPFCLIIGSVQPLTFVEDAADCSFLAASELMLDLRREELHPQLMSKLATITVPEPQLGQLALAGLGSLVALRRRTR